jgi:hypothetical protein
VKPGSCDQLPNGGLVIMVEDILLTVVNTGLPYDHGQYPVTHFGHLDTGGFYATARSSTCALQKEYNMTRSDISEAGRRWRSAVLPPPRARSYERRSRTSPGS